MIYSDKPLYISILNLVPCRPLKLFTEQRVYKNLLLARSAEDKAKFLQGAQPEVRPMCRAGNGAGQPNVIHSVEDRRKAGYHFLFCQYRADAEMRSKSKRRMTRSIGARDVKDVGIRILVGIAIGRAKARHDDRS